MALRTRVWGAGKLLVVGGALLATYLLFAVVGMQIALRAREVTVPDLRGATVNEAQATLFELDLGLQVEDTRQPDPRMEADRILSQKPPPGVAIRRQRDVRVRLSAGHRASAVPALVGQPEGTATVRLMQDGFTLHTLAEIRSGLHPTGAIVAQTPSAGAEAADVSVLVNRGERSATYVMPDLIGVGGDAAAELLRASGFRVTVVGEHPYPGLAAGIVLRQYPQAGFQIAPGEPISLEVSR